MLDIAKKSWIMVGIVGLLLVGSIHAGTIGNPIVAGTDVDTCNGCTFVLLTPFAAADAGDVVTLFSLYAAQAGNQITPLIFNQVGGSYVVTGVGTPDTIAAIGAQTFAFSLVSGSDFIGATSYFGYRDGTVSAGSGATTPNDTVAFNNASSGALMQYFGSAGPGQSPNIYVGESLRSDGGTTVAGGPEAGGLAYSSSALPRVYSLSVTDAAPVTGAPEPATAALMLGGGIMVWLRRRKRA